MNEELREQLKAQLCAAIDALSGDFTVVIVPHEKDASIRTWVNGQEQRSPIETVEESVSVAVTAFTNAMVARDPEGTLAKIRAMRGTKL